MKPAVALALQLGAMRTNGLGSPASKQAGATPGPASPQGIRSSEFALQLSAATGPIFLGE